MGQPCTGRGYGEGEAQGGHQPLPSRPCPHSTSPPASMLPEEECGRVCRGSQVGTLRLKNPDPLGAARQRRVLLGDPQPPRASHGEWGLLEPSCFGILD